MKKKSYNIGIMGGRLSEPIGNEIQSFPKNSWKEEFSKAAYCGFDLIEWVFDLYDKNPILDNDGIKEINFLSEKYSIMITSICADFFMTKKLFNESEFELEKNLSVLKKLICNCNKLRIKILEIPLIDSSSLQNNDAELQLVKNLQKILPILEQNDVKLTFETDLPPNSFRKFLELFEHQNIKANYDTGNSAALGYNVKEELEILGKFITNIHIKDRIYRGNTVPLGTGDTNFELFFSILQHINYQGDFVIQGARENKSLKPEAICKKYLEFVKKYVDKYLQ